MKILLHICCAPCAVFPLEALKASGHRVRGFFSNPNIHPYQEYHRRASTLEAYAAKAGTIASDGNGANSPYALSLSRHLGEQGLEVTKLFRLVRDDVLAATGQRQAAFARASIPTMAAKESAFVQAVDNDDLPNALLGATVGGFLHPDQRELCRAFVPRYFDAITRVWNERTNEMAQIVVEGLYPAQIVEPGTLALTDAFLARTDIPEGARRLVNEGRDGIERSLRCQAVDS